MRLVLLILLLLSTAFTQQPVTPKSVADPIPFAVFAKETYMPAVFTLYTQKEDGGYDMHCTLTAFESKPDGNKNRVRFVTAGHCVRKMPQLLKILFDAEDIGTSYFIARDDNSDEKTYLRATLIGRGRLNVGEDVAVFEAVTREKIPTVALGNDPTDVIDEPVMNIANPLGIGTQVFRGRVTRLKLDRHTGPAGSDWFGYSLVQIFGVDGGASGSSAVCEKQQKICLFIVGTFNGTTMVAVPVSTFKTWYADFQKPKSLFQFDMKKPYPAHPPKFKGPSKPKQPRPKK